MVAGALAQFGSRHLMTGARLTHGQTGHPVAVRYYCPDCDQGLPASEVRAEINGRPTMDPAPHRP
jgi:hypothetical protein